MQEHAKEKAHWLLLEKFPPVSDSTWDMPAVIARVHESPPYFGEYISPYPLASERLDSKRWGVHGCFIVSLFSLGLISLCPIPIANWNIHVSSQAHLCSVLNSRRFPRTSSSRTHQQNTKIPDISWNIWGVPGSSWTPGNSIFRGFQSLSGAPDAQKQDWCRGLASWSSWKLLEAPGECLSSSPGASRQLVNFVFC